MPSTANEEWLPINRQGWSGMLSVLTNVGLNRRLMILYEVLLAVNGGGVTANAFLI